MSVFDQALVEAVKASLALDGIPQRKLSATAFVTKALKNADCTQGDLDSLESKMTQLISPAAAAFVRSVTKPFDSGNVSEPDRKWARLGRVYGSEGLAVDLALLKTNIPILYALAIRRLVEKKPGLFGEINDLDEYDAEVTRRARRLGAACQKMRSLVCGDDLLIEPDTLPPSLRDQGLALILFT